MPKGPPVHEIFNPPAAPGTKSVPFHYSKKETKTQTQLTPKKSLAPLPPMKKFGGYKPKILSNNEDLIPASSNKKTRPPEPPVENRRPPITLTQPKPFIIGDKNTPMILSTVDDDMHDGDTSNIDLQNGVDEVHIYEEPPMYMPTRDNGNADEMNNNDLNNIKNNNNNKLNNHNKDDFKHSNIHSHPNNNEAFTVTNETDNLITKNHTENDATVFATENPVFNNSDTLLVRSNDDDNRGMENKSEPDVFIPPPDYDEEEQTMDFDEEDPDEIAEEERKAHVHLQQRIQYLKEQQQNETRMKVYDGEDLSKYLSDDEDDFYREPANNSKTLPTRLNQKHSLFKTNPSNNAGKKKTNHKKQAPKLNNVRNFSFADSKYATSGKAYGKKITVGGGGGGGGGGGCGDYESFLSTSQQGEGYETFLTSKHGVGADSPSSGHTAYRPQHNGRKAEDGNGIWKKLTVRLKHKLQKNGYDMREEHF